MIANGIFMSHLIYIIQVWAGCSQYLLDTLQILQNKAAREVTKLDRYTPITTLLNQCNWLSVRQMIVYYDILMVFKIRKDKKPIYLYEKLSDKYAYETRFAANNEIRQVQLPQSEISRTAFVNRSITSWNRLPKEVTDNTNEEAFKTCLRSWVKNNIEPN